MPRNPARPFPDPGQVVGRWRLRKAIDASGLSVSGYARGVLVRDPLTVHRWLRGEQPIPRAVLDKLRHAG